MIVPLSLEARTRRPRDEVVRALLDALAPRADVLDTRSFSGLLLVLELDAERRALPELAPALRAIGAPLSHASEARLTEAAVGAATDRIPMMLDVTFVDGDADLRHPVPKVPG